MLAPQTIDPCQSEQVISIMDRAMRAQSGRGNVPPGFYGFASTRGVPDGSLLYEANTDSGRVLRCAVSLNTTRGTMPGVITLERDPYAAATTATVTWMNAGQFAKYADKRNAAIRQQITDGLNHPSYLTCVAHETPGVIPSIFYNCQ